MNENVPCGFEGKDNTGCAQNHCGRCCGGACSGCDESLYLSEGEIEMLWEFAQFSFLPVAFGNDGMPAYLEADAFSRQEYSHILFLLCQKHIISIDHDVPLPNFDYGAYKEYERHGSMALTAYGQQVVDQAEKQGIM